MLYLYWFPLRSTPCRVRSLEFIIILIMRRYRGWWECIVMNQTDDIIAKGDQLFFIFGVIVSGLYLVTVRSYFFDIIYDGYSHLNDMLFGGVDMLFSFLSLVGGLFRLIHWFGLFMYHFFNDANQIPLIQFNYFHYVVCLININIILIWPIVLPFRLDFVCIGLNVDSFQPLLTEPFLLDFGCV